LTEKHFWGTLTPVLKRAFVLNSLALGLLLSSGCSRNPDELLESGKKYLAEQKYKEAAIELKNAITGNPRMVEAHYQLGVAYASLGQLADASKEFSSTVLLDPNHLEAQLRHGYLLLFERKFDESRTTTELLLNRNPKSTRAQILLASSYAGLFPLNDSLQELRRAFEIEPRLLPPFLDLAATPKFQRQPDLAENAFKKAVADAPGSLEASLALADFYLQSKRFAEAEEHFKAALAIESNARDARQALAFFYAQTGKLDLAEQFYLDLANQRRQDSAPRIILADFYAEAGKSDKAINTLETIGEGQPQYRVARERLATIYFNQKSYEPALQVLDQILKADNQNANALVLKGRSLLALGRNVDGIAELKKAVTARPASAVARFFLGVGYQQDYKLEQAEATWNETLGIDGRFVQAHLSLAQLKLAAGDTNQAIAHAEDVLKSSPGLPAALLVLGDAYLMKKDFSNAERVFQTLLQQKPGDAIMLGRLGSAYAGQGNFSKAEAQIREALRLRPDSIESITALTNLYLLQRKPDVAIQWIEQQIKQYPNNEALYELLGKVYLRQKDYVRAEASYRKALSIDASSLDAYSLLGQLFMIQGSLDKAANEFENVLKIDSKSISAHIILGSIDESRKSGDKAQFHYRQALQLDPHSPPAANNLAWLLAESGGNLDEALNLARTALERLPKSAKVLDTVGWIYYKKGAYGSAADFLKQAALQNPENAVYHYHLGMTYFLQGDSQKAGASLRRAVTLNPKFSEMDAVRNALAKLESR